MALASAPIWCLKEHLEEHFPFCGVGHIKDLKEKCMGAINLNENVAGPLVKR
jgi:hypothetical protein